MVCCAGAAPNGPTCGASRGSRTQQPGIAKVSDNVDWAVVPGVRLIPTSREPRGASWRRAPRFFDLDGSAKPRDQASAAGWPDVDSLRVAYTSADLVAEHLRLGHPPKEEELKERAM